MHVSHHQGVFRWSRFYILFVIEDFAKRSQVEATWRETENKSDWVWSIQEPTIKHTPFCDLIFQSEKEKSLYSMKTSFFFVGCTEEHFAVIPRSFKPFSTKHVACGVFLALWWELWAFKCVTKHKVGEQVTALCTGSSRLCVCIFKRILAHLKSSCKPWAVFTAVITDLSNEYRLMLLIRFLEVFARWCSIV